jgi:hypothetical protein
VNIAKLPEPLQQKCVVTPIALALRAGDGE